MTSPTAWWRKWHRWIAFPASLFLLFAAVTGFLVAFTEFFGEEEALRERTRDLVSPVSVASDPGAWRDPLARAVEGARAVVPNAPIDKVEMQFKGDAPTVAVFLGKVGGGEDRKLVFAAASGALLATEAYVDKPFLYRLHSGEAFGDGGLVVAMIWALALVALTISGFIVWYGVFARVHTPSHRGWRRFFY